MSRRGSLTPRVGVRHFIVLALSSGRATRVLGCERLMPPRPKRARSAGTMWVMSHEAATLAPCWAGSTVAGASPHRAALARRNGVHVRESSPQQQPRPFLWPKRHIVRPPRAVVPSIRLTTGDLPEQYRCLERLLSFDSPRSRSRVFSRWCISSKRVDVQPVTTLCASSGCAGSKCARSPARDVPRPFASTLAVLFGSTLAVPSASRQA